MPKTEIPGSQVKDGSLTDTDVAAANKDGAAGTPSMRTLGTGAAQACAGDDARLSDSRTDDTAIHDDVSAEISAVAEKASPVSADLLLIEDSAASNAKKRIQIGNLPTGSDADAIHDNVAGEISAVTEKTTPVNADFLLIEDSAAANAKKRVQLGNLPGAGGTHTMFFPIPTSAQPNGDYLVETVGTSGDTSLSFMIPADFVSLVSLEIFGTPTAGASGSGKNIDITSDYGAVGESIVQHSEADITSTYDFTGKNGEWMAIDLSGIFTAIIAGDICGFLLDHNAIGGGIDYAGVRMVYNL